MEEIWKDIPGYEGYYQASNKGKIKSLLFQNNVCNKKYPREKILKAKKSKDNCLRVELWKEGQHKTWLVYRLIAMTFLGIPKDKKLTINHKDGNRLNNNIDNLEWLSLAENIKHGFRTGLYKKCKNITLIKDGEEYQFNSLSEASTWMGKYKGYLSEKIKKGVFGNEYYRWRT